VALGRTCLRFRGSVGHFLEDVSATRPYRRGFWEFLRRAFQRYIRTDGVWGAIADFFEKDISAVLGERISGLGRRVSDTSAQEGFLGVLANSLSAAHPYRWGFGMRVYGNWCCIVTKVFVGTCR